MASDETPADTVIEAVALAISKHRHGSQAAWDEDRRLARALQAAGLLADPADRDEPYDQLDNQRNLWAKQCHEAEARAERAEAEVARLSMAKVNQRDAETEAANAVSDLATAEAERDELRATVDRVTTLRDHWAHMAGLAMDADTREWLDAASKSLRAALDPEGGA